MAEVVCEDIEFASADGASICRGHIWRSDRAPRASVQIIHGMTEHIGRYDGFARTLAARGYIVAGIDQLGHGRTTPDPAGRGVYDPEHGADQLIADQRSLHELMRGRAPELPHFIIGHSMGSFVARSYLGRFGSELAGAVILGTGWMPGPVIAANRAVLRASALVRGWKHRSSVIDKLGMGGFNKRFAATCEGEPTGSEWVSRDPACVKALIDDPDCGFMFSLSGYYTVMALMREAQDSRRIARIPKDLPVLIASGTDDPVGDFGSGPTTLAETLRAAGLADVTLELVDGARHELINETNSAQIIAGIESWIEERIA